MPEIWKPVPSCPGMLASSEGRILLPPRYLPLPNGGYRKVEPKPFAGVETSSRKGARHTYRGAWLRSYGNVKIHRLVCEAFHGPAPFEGAVVIHIDEDAHNNRPANLKWGTQKENLNAPGFKAYCRSPERAAQIRAKRRKAA